MKGIRQFPVAILMAALLSIIAATAVSSPSVLAGGADPESFEYPRPSRVNAGARLAALDFHGVALEPRFDPDRADYQGYMDSWEMDSTTVTATAEDADATVTISLADADVDAAGHQVDLVGGEDVAVEVTVTSSDGTSESVYRVTMKYGDALLSNAGQETAGLELINRYYSVSQPFTTGQNTAGYELTAISLRSSFVPPGVPIAVKLRRADDENENAPSDAALTSFASPTSWIVGVNHFTPRASVVVLQPNTTYHIQMTATAPITVDLTDTLEADGDSASDWSLSRRWRNFGGAAWSEGAHDYAYQIIVHGEARSGDATPAAPDMIDNLSAAPADSSVTLKWSPPSDNGTAITKFQYRSKIGAGEFNPSDTWTDIPGDGDATAYTVSDLNNGTVYRFQVRAVNVLAAADSNEAMAIPNALLLGNADQSIRPGVWELSKLHAFSQPVTLSDAGPDYMLTSLELYGSHRAEPDVRTQLDLSGLTVTLQTDDGSGNPSGAVLATFENPAVWVAGPNTFTLPAPVMLERGTEYHIHITLVRSNTVRPRGEYVVGLSTQSDSLDGLSFNRYRYRIFSGDPWEYVTDLAQALQLTLRGAAKPNTPATGAPTISGTVQVGETLTADTSDISDDDGLTNVSHSYQWVANDGSSDADIANATESTYTLTSAEAGQTIKVRVSFTDDRGNAESLTSAATEAVSATSQQQANSPATGAPTIGGTAQVGETLTADISSIADEDGLDNATFAYQWQADGSDIVEATASSYTLTDADEGKAISVTVSFTDDAGNAESLTSAATDAVAARPNTPATGLPTISGTAQVGETLTVDVSGIGDADGLTNVSYSYQWQADGADISGATASTYTLVDADEDRAISITVSFTDDAGNNETLTSAATAAVAARPNTPATGLPTISGTPQVGETLTADTSGIADNDGLTNVSYTYQWRADDADIAGATGSTYVLVDADEGKAISVTVSFTDDAGNAEALTSAATDTVAGPPPEPLTASFSNGPSSHDGENVFTFELRFSEEFSVSYKRLRDQAFDVTGGDVTRAKRLERGSNVGWRIHVRPDGDGAVSIILPETTDCEATGAICAGDGRMLSNRSELTVGGP